MSGTPSEDRLTIAYRGTLYELAYSEYVNLSVQDFLVAVKLILNLNHDVSICARNGSIPSLDLKAPLASFLEMIGNERHLIALARDDQEPHFLSSENEKAGKTVDKKLLFLNTQEVGSFRGNLNGEYSRQVFTIGTKYILIPCEMVSMLRRYAEEDKNLVWINRLLGVFTGACVSLVVPLVDAAHLSGPVRGALYGGGAVCVIAVISLFFLANRAESKSRTGLEEFERAVQSYAPGDTP
jgi:hypothetical protein